MYFVLKHILRFDTLSRVTKNVAEDTETGETTEAVFTYDAAGISIEKNRTGLLHIDSCNSPYLYC